ncbi:MAG: hypothetical protein JXQ87_18030 [Bacteroidia bacterium]
MKHLLLVLLIACSNNNNRSHKHHLIAAIENQKKEKEIKSSVQNNVEKFNEECLFDLSTQTSKFLDSIPEFSVYTWDDKHKRATIELASGDTLFAARGGCHHFGISGKLNVNEKIDLDSIEIIIDKCKWIAKRIFDSADNEELNYLLKNKNYSLNKSDDRILINLNHEYYLDYSIYAFRRKNGKLTIGIGYYRI